MLSTCSCNTTSNTLSIYSVVCIIGPEYRTTHDHEKSEVKLVGQNVSEMKVMGQERSELKVEGQKKN